MSAASIGRVFRGAYAIDATDLNAIERVANQIAGKPETQLQFANGRMVAYDSVDAALADPLLQSDMLNSLRISNSRPNASVRVEFNRHWGYPVTVDIKAQRRDALSLETEITSLLKRPEKWFHGLRRFLSVPADFNTLLASFSVVVAAAALALLVFGLPESLPFWLTVAGVVVLPIFAALNFLPSMQFNLGAEQKRLSKRSKILGIVFIALLVPLAVNWFTSGWTGPMEWLWR